MKVIVETPLSTFTGYGNDGIGLIQALQRWGADVYVNPKNVDPPLLPEIAVLLTRQLEKPFDLAIHHIDPMQMEMDPTKVLASKINVGWSMWEYSTVDNMKGKSDFGKRTRFYDALIGYDSVTVEAFRPRMMKHRTVEPVKMPDGRETGRIVKTNEDVKLLALQGGFWPETWEKVERDWFGDRFGFCMVGQLHERKEPFLAIEAFGELKQDGGFDGAELHLKASPVSAPVLTPTGWRRMGDVSVGDLLVDPLGGGSQKIEGVYPQGEQDIYCVRLSDGSEAECTLDHLWQVKNDAGPWRVMSLAELLESGLRRKAHIRWEVPAVAPVEYEPVELPWDPYLLGLLLGDGALTQDIRFGSADPELLAECKARLPEGASWSDYGERTSCRWIGLRGMLPVARELGIFGKRSVEKSIPQLYLRGSVVERQALLRGLMDTDGTPGSKANAASFSTSSPQLALDVQELVRSLGGNAPSHRYRSASGRQTFQVKVIGLECPFQLARKVEKWQAVVRCHQLRRRIVSVDFVRREEAQCIRVSGVEGLYVTGDFVVTHNTQVPGLLAAMESVYPKLRVYYEHWPVAKLKQFYASQHVLLAPSRGEGKNMPALEMMSTGGTVIATNWGGHTQWIDDSIAYPIDYTLAPISGKYPNCMNARASKEHLKQLMWEAYTNRAGAKMRGDRAAKHIPQMCSWDAVVERLFLQLKHELGDKGQVLWEKAVACRRVLDED